MDLEENQLTYKSIEKINRFTTGKALDLIINSLWLESISA